MKQKITKGKVVQNCLRVTAAIVVAGGVGFQFHENQGLNEDLNALKQEHKQTVQQLSRMNESNKELKKYNLEMKDAKGKLSDKLDKLEKANKSIQKETESLKQENQKLKLKNGDLEKKLQEEREHPSVAITSNSKSHSTHISKVSSQTTASTRIINGVGTAYTAHCKGCSGKTTSGKTVSSGMVAMSRSVPLGTRVRITCPDYPSINGVYTVEDRGGAINGSHVDIFMASQEQAVKFGKRNIKIEILS